MFNVAPERPKETLLNPRLLMFSLVPGPMRIERRKRKLPIVAFSEDELI